MKKSHDDIFKEYYTSNKGKLFKPLELDINGYHYSYDIYWGNPEIIFDENTRKNGAPLAVKIMPTRLNAPNPRIFVHEGLTQEYGDVFDLVVAHEIGHLFLDDVVGLTRPSALYYVDVNQAEAWADYFAYCFFREYRDMDKIDDFYSILKDVGKIQIQLYNREHLQGMDEKISDLKNLNQSIQENLESKNPVVIQITEAIKITLNTIGDIFG